MHDALAARNRILCAFVADDLAGSTPEFVAPHDLLHAPRVARGVSRHCAPFTAECETSSEFGGYAARLIERSPTTNRDGGRR